jgi:hypothetical protein
MASVMILVAATAGAARAQTLTVDEALENYRDSFSPVSVLDCPKSAGDEIVVCGRAVGAPDPYRLPLPVEPVPGDRIAGESLSAAEVANRKESCSPVGPHNGCGGLVPVGVIIGVAVKAVQALVDPNE